MHSGYIPISPKTSSHRGLAYIGSLVQTAIVTILYIKKFHSNRKVYKDSKNLNRWYVLGLLFCYFILLYYFTCEFF